MERRRDDYGAHASQPDYSGLQVVQESSAPEVDHSAHSLPKAFPGKHQAHAGPYAHAPLIPYKDADAPEVNGSHEANEAALPPSASRQPWWKRKRWIIAIVVIILIIIGAVVGGVVATRGTSSPANSPNSTSPTQRSACRDQVCPQILASAALNAWTPSPSILLFARGIDNSIWYTYAAASNLSPSWPPAQKWQSLGSGGPLLSQPSALTWGNGTRASVFALSDPNHMVRTLKFTDAAKIPTWEVLGGPLSAPVSTCSVFGSRPDLWSSTDDDIKHNFGAGEKYDAKWNVASDGQWTTDYFFDTKITSRPGVLCRSSVYFHDLVVYGTDGAVRHAQFSDKTGWTPASNRGGKMVGEPVVVEVNGERIDFFGIGEDKHMYHFTWTSDGGYTPLEDAGGSFQSVPSVAVTGAGSRVDVVALGTNDRLQHRVLKGLTWASDWEDLGVFGNSAPLLVNITKTQPEKVGVFVVGERGEMNQTTWSASSDLSWKDLVWKGMGGNMTTEFSRN